jgi:hypothetical protein
MAERRMFSKHIIDSDDFLNMPLSSQVLYFHLTMRADDDGFINNTQKIMRMIGSSPDDFKILLAKSFIISFDSGIIVIRHWLVHNYIRNDRYKPTTHIDEKKSISVKEDKTYTVSTVGIPSDIPLVSTGKVRLELEIGKDNITTDRFEMFWTAYPKKIGKDKCRRWFASHKITDTLLDNMLNALDTQKRSSQWSKDDGQFIPHPYTWLNQGRWQDEVEQSRWDKIDMEGF